MVLEENCSSSPPVVSKNISTASTSSIKAKVYFVRVREGQRTVHVTQISSSEQYVRTARTPPDFYFACAGRTCALNSLAVISLSFRGGIDSKDSRSKTA